MDYSKHTIRGKKIRQLVLGFIPLKVFISVPYNRDNCGKCGILFKNLNDTTISFTILYQGKNTPLCNECGVKFRDAGANCLRDGRTETEKRKDKIKQIIDDENV